LAASALDLAVRYILPGESALESLQFLLERLKTLGFSSKVLYMDKGFASTPILKYLTARGQPAIIACPIRGKKGGIRALCQEPPVTLPNIPSPMALQPPWC